MLETLVVLWISVTFCMTLDHIRQYRKVINIVKSVMSYSVYMLNSFSDEDSLTQYKKNLDNEFNKHHSYFSFIIVTVLTMSLVWAIALYGLIFRQKSYEKGIQSSMLARFAGVLELSSHAISIALIKKNNLVDSMFSNQEED